MLDDQQLEEAVRDLLLDLCEVMHRRNYEAVSVGAMMRLVGVPVERASQHDQEYFALDQEFEQMLQQRRAGQDDKKKHNKKKTRQPQAPDGVTLH